MKFLINKDFEAIRCGDFVRADSSNGEFIYDTDDSEALTVSQLSEIADAQGFEIHQKKKTEFQKELNKLLEELDLPTQDTPTETEKVEEIVKRGFENDKSDDEMLIEMVTSGVSFRRAGKLFKDTVERLGLRVSLKDVKEVANEYLEDVRFSPTTYDEVEAAVADLVKNVEGATYKQARLAVRKFAKDNEIALPKPEKSRRGAIGFKNTVFEWILEHPKATIDQLGKFGESKGKDKEKIERQFGPILVLCQKFADKVAPQENATEDEAAE